MTEPAMTPEQSALLRYLFSRRLKNACYCTESSECSRCEDMERIKAAFPGTFVQACVDAAKGKNG